MSGQTATGLRGMGVGVMERFRRTHALALLPSLLDSQYHTPGQLQKVQIERLRSHLEHCRDNISFYRDLFEDIGFDPADFGNLSDLEQIPVMTKPVIKEAGDGLRASGFGSYQPRAKSTSGSTGVPLNYFLDRDSHSYLWAHIWRGWSEAGYSPGDRYATLSGGSLLPEKVDLKQRVYLYLSGAVHFPSYHLTEALMDGYADRLKRSRIRYLYGYPSSVELFAKHLLDRGAPRLSLDAVFTTSELLSSEARATIEAGTGAPVYDTYGCNDGGAYAFECKEHNGWHQDMESCVVEIVDELGRQVPDGTVGTIVATHFVNRAYPLLRYDTGDRGAVDRSKCPCGRGLLRIVDIQGRERDIVITPTGRKVHGAFFNHFEPFYEAAWLDRYQIFQPDQQTIVVRMKTRRSPSTEERDDIIRLLKLGLDDMEIELTEVEEFELTAKGKFRVVISRLA